MKNKHNSNVQAVIFCPITIQKISSESFIEICTVV